LCLSLYIYVFSCLYGERRPRKELLKGGLCAFFNLQQLGISQQSSFSRVSYCEACLP
ncbi:hypothetical protein CSUI_009398, partial [Cystoisospora suis]